MKINRLIQTKITNTIIITKEKTKGKVKNFRSLVMLHLKKIQWNLVNVAVHVIKNKNHFQYYKTPMIKMMGDLFVQVNLLEAQIWKI
jgi:hypothetical protein